MLNNYIKQVFDIMDPVSLDEIREIHELLSNTKFSIDFQNIHSIYHMVQSIVNQSNSILDIRGKNHPPMSTDSTDKLIDFALANEVTTENSIFLLRSERFKYYVKIFTLKLNE